jgi:hypothetical protein
VPPGDAGELPGCHSLGVSGARPASTTVFATPSQNTYIVDTHRDAVRVYDIDVTNLSCYCTEANVITIRSQYFLYNPSVVVDGQGDVTVVYNSSDASSRYPSIAWATRTSSGWQGAQFLVQGNTLDNANHNYWGDYAGSAADSVDGATVWVFNMYATGNSWGTYGGIVVVG